MSRGWLARLLGIGRVRPVVRETLEDEGFLVLDEGIKITIHYRNYRAPGKWIHHRKQWTRGAVVVTGQRLIAFGLVRKILNVRLEDPRLAGLAFALESPDVLAVTIDPSIFHDDRSGEVVYRFHTVHAREILSIVDARQRPMPAGQRRSSRTR